MADLMQILSDAAARSRLPAGMRNNNPGNIKYVGQKVPGIVGPSVNTDQGDPQAVFDSPESGMRAMYQLLQKKYAGGKLTPNQMIAGNMGWTPGNFEAAANVARYAGIKPDDDIGLNDPGKAGRFVRALMRQEHGKASDLYTDQMIASAVGGAPLPVGSVPGTMAVASVAKPTSQPQPPSEQPVVNTGNANYATPVPASVKDYAGSGPKHGIADIFSLLALNNQPQPVQVAPIQGPTAQQANALNEALQALRRRFA